MSKRKRQQRSSGTVGNLQSKAAMDFFVRRGSNAVPVTSETVLGYPAVWRGVNLVSWTIARLPLLTYQRKPNNGRDEAKTHPAYRLLKRQPSALHTPSVFKSTLQSHAMIRGNGFASIVRDPISNAPTELLILDPDKVGVVLNGGDLSYTYRIESEDVRLLASDVLHVKGLSSNGIVGYSIVDVLSESLGLGLAAQKYGAIFFKNNGSPGPTIIKLPTYLKDKEKVERFRREWGNLHEGLDNAHRVALLEGGADIAPNTIDHEAAQFLETREFEVRQIANIIGCPAHKLGANIHTSYNSLEQENKSFLNDIDAWLTVWEEECSAKLLSEAEKETDSHYVEFVRSALEQADKRTELELIVSEVNNGLLTLNEANALRNKPGIGADGDKHRMPANLIFVEDAANPEPPPAPLQQAPGDAAPPDQAPTDQAPPDAATARLKRLTASTVKRLLARLDKATVAASKRDDWHQWLEAGLAEHRTVLAEALEPVSDQAGAIVDALLTDLRMELAAVTRDQAGECIKRVDPDKLTMRLLA